MSNIKKSREQEVLDLVKYILDNYGYEDTIYYKDIERLTRIDRESGAFMYIMAQVKNILTNYGIVLICIAEEGYKILAPNKVADYVVNRYLIKSVAMLDKGRTVLHYVNRNDLTKTEREKADKIEAFIDELRKDNENKIMSENLLMNSARIKELN